MFSHEIKAAIKTALAMSLTLMAVHWLGWQKASWALIAVLVLSLTDSYGYSVLKSQNRLIGTVFGALMAFAVLMAFSQDRLLFLLSIGVFLTFCVYMAFDLRRGYIYNIAITVFLIICSAGIDSGATGLSTAILRLQETLLGLIIYSLVFRLVWPVTNESEFYRNAESVLNEMQQQLAKYLQSGEIENKSKFKFSDQSKHIALLKSFLTLPTSNKTNLTNKTELLELFLNGLKHVQRRAHSLPVINSEDEVYKLLEIVKQLRELLNNGSKASLQFAMQLPVEPDTPLARASLYRRLRGVLMSLTVSVVVIMMWIYMPVPGGALFPIFGLIIAINIAELPSKLVAPVLFSYLFFVLINLLQYTLIMPTLTESWQLAALFGVNVLIGFILCDKFHLSPLKVLMGNALININGSALELVPTYNIVSPIMIMVFMFLVFVIAGFVARFIEDGEHLIRTRR